MMKNYSFALILLAVGMLFSCKTSAPNALEPQYTMYNQKIPVSSLNIPLKIDHADLENIILRASKDLKMESGPNPQDGVTWKMNMTKPPRVMLEGQEILSIIPLNITVGKEGFLGKIKADGELEVHLKTLFHIRPDWTTQTYTTLEHHQWLRKPVAQFGGLRLPIGPLTDLIIRYSKKQITETIDEQIRKELDLKTRLKPIWDQLKQPILLSDTMKIWFQFTPNQVGLEPFLNRNNALNSAAHVKGFARLKIGSPPISPASQDIEYGLNAEGEDSLRIVINAEVPYESIKLIASQRIIGQTYKSGEKQLTIEDLEAFGQGDKLVLKLKTTGDYKGVIYLKGRPHFDKENNRVDLSDLDFDLETKNVLHRSAGWIFKGPLRNILEKNLVFPLDQNFESLRKEMDNQINHGAIAKWLRMETEGIQLGLEDIYLSPDGIQLNFLLSGLVTVHLKDWQ